ncbi:unnamed protein product [Adineta steineri]|uniref:Protein kinase domain-containing protein n=1 Tax=Adineta steineri TaxID=433720 RepID=A0A818NIP5_9BILA|nr:unnamed protein product [Adineta steineri]CAF3605593.1 unnamed protein product [Adineta steineri]
MTTGANTDQTQWHTVTCKEIIYTLPIRYQNPVPISQGAFGSVIRATDTETGRQVAIKKMLKPFQTPEHAKRTYRELKLLMHLNHIDAQIVQIYNVFTPEQNVNQFQTLYFVFNYCQYDLDRVIRRRIPFTEEHIKHIIYSLFRGLKFMHSAGVIHRDLKPSNIGIDENCNVTILDFGLARVLSDGIQTGYVATRWWRAPEVFVHWERYNDKLDIWSIGCIMAELILLRPIFRGTDHVDQLNKIFDLIGTPNLATLNETCTPELLYIVQYNYNYTENVLDAISYISRLQPRAKVDFNQLFGFRYQPGEAAPVSGVSSHGIDLLNHLLTFDPRLRPTAEEALAHPFLSGIREPTEEEPSMEPVVDEHQDANQSTAQWKSLIWSMIENFQPPSWINEGIDNNT